MAMAMETLSDVSLLFKAFCRPHYKSYNFITPLSNPNCLPKRDLILPTHVSKMLELHVSCCDGLLLIDDKNGHCILWNPSTGEHKVLPSTSLVSPVDAYKIATSFFCSSFGFDRISDDYKIVRFFESFPRDVDYPGMEAPQVEIYSLKSNSWKEISFSVKVFPDQEQATYLDGVCYWIVYEEFDFDKGEFILSFDFSTEVFSRIPFPCKIEFFGNYSALLELHGKLAFVVSPLVVEEGSWFFCFWVWNNGFWTQKRTIRTTIRPGCVRTIRTTIRTTTKPGCVCPKEEKTDQKIYPLMFWKNGRQMFFKDSDDELFLYDFVTEELTSIIGSCYKDVQLIPYVQSSFQLNQCQLIGETNLAKKRKGNRSSKLNQSLKRCSFQLNQSQLNGETNLAKKRNGNRSLKLNQSLKRCLFQLNGEKLNQSLKRCSFQLNGKTLTKKRKGNRGSKRSKL